MASTPLQLKELGLPCFFIGLALRERRPCWLGGLDLEQRNAGSVATHSEPFPSRASNRTLMTVQMDPLLGQGQTVIQDRKFMELLGQKFFSFRLETTPA